MDDWNFAQLKQTDDTSLVGIDTHGGVELEYIVCFINQNRVVVIWIDVEKTVGVVDSGIAA